MVTEQRDDLLGFIQPHEAVVDIDAGELITDRFVNQHCRDRAVDPARKPADHPT